MLHFVIGCIGLYFAAALAISGAYLLVRYWWVWLLLALTITAAIGA